MSEIVKVILEVKNIEGLYDERAEAVTLDISNRCLCFKHKFINASLYWEKEIIDTPSERDKGSGRLYSVSLECPERKGFNYEWGMGYGGIRVCRNCKLIDCLHYFNNEVEYRVVRDEFFYTAHIVSRCQICERKILRQGWGSYNNDPKVWEIINRIAKDLNKPLINSPDGGYGSNYYTVFPAEASRRLKVSEQECEKYVRDIFIKGECR